jgi:hypothetical protein
MIPRQLTSRCFAVAAALPLVLVLHAPRVAAQSSASQSSAPSVGNARAAKARKIVVDHKARTIWLVDGRDTISIDEETRVPRGIAIPVVVSNSNSALYSCSASQKAIGVPELDSLRAALALLAPYGPLVGGLVDKAHGLWTKPGSVMPSVKDTTSTAVAEALRESLNALSTFVFGRNGLNDTRLKALRALEDIRKAEGDEIAARAQRFARELQDSARAPSGEIQGMPAVALDRLRAVQQRRDSAVDVLIAPPKGVTSAQLGRLDSLRKIADEVLSHHDELVAATYTVERLIATTSKAAAEFTCDTVQVSLSKGRELALRVGSREAPELARAGSLAGLEKTINVLPRWRIQPEVGISLLRAGGATYPNFGVVPAGDSVKVVRTGTQDSRYSYGFTLGASVSIPKRRGGTLPLSLAPQLTVQPSDELKMFGVGGAVTVGWLRLGTGVLWTKHTALDDGLAEEDILADAAFFRTRDSYSGSKRYMSITIVGWPPFMRSKE